MHEPLIKALTIVTDLNNIMAGHVIHVIGRTFFKQLGKPIEWQSKHFSLVC